MRQSDVLVVGAGPAGAWAAYRLARTGARVRIFDGSHPREKPSAAAAGTMHHLPTAAIATPPAPGFFAHRLAALV